MTRNVTLHFHTEPVLMRVVRKQTGAAATALGATEQRAGWIELAVSEALSNAYFHGYGGALGPVEVEIACEGDTFGITIHDAGRGLPSAGDLPTGPNPQAGGGGLRVIRELMDEVVLSPGPKGAGTTVRMSIHLRKDAEANPRAGDRFRREPYWQ